VQLGYGRAQKLLVVFILMKRKVGEILSSLLLTRDRSSEDIGVTRSRGSSSTAAAKNGDVLKKARVNAGRGCIYKGDDPDFQCSRKGVGKERLCLRHGGGRRCIAVGCKKSAACGPYHLCIAHGGGKRCAEEGCDKVKQGKSTFCAAHGGGRRCETPGCKKVALSGPLMRCTEHGGGQKCAIEGCTKVKVSGGRGGFCFSHGGAKRCSIAGCERTARGKTKEKPLCRRHGGGSICLQTGCERQSPYTLSYCRRHGKTCQIQDCERLAYRLLDVCKNHVPPKEDVTPSDDNVSPRKEDVTPEVSI